MTRLREHGRHPIRVYDELQARAKRAEATAAAIARVEEALRRHKRDGGRNRHTRLTDEEAALLASAAQVWLDLSYVIPRALNPSEGHTEPVSYADTVKILCRVTDCDTIEARRRLNRATDLLGVIPHFARPRGRDWQLCVTASDRRAIFMHLGTPEEVIEDAEP
jgi:hypothetical protein